VSRFCALAVLLLLLGACSSGAPSSASGPAPTVLAADQARIAGVFTRATIFGISSVPLGLPLTITIPVRGHGELNIKGVSVASVGSAEISWDGGQPLPLAGTGTLSLGQVTMDIDASGTTWHLDGTTRFLSPGLYTAESSVAVGSGGLGQPRDRQDFSVPAGTQAQLVTIGDAQIHTPLATLQLRGPGGVDLVGGLTVTTASGTRSVHEVVLSAGDFQLTAGSGRVSGLLQGALVTH
jgi:hypothetical protein